ncbi:mechanosensitive ion channel family protein [Candidatus Parcubacteria bacterium]|nr:mechanosensitive ion channel family protein [Candidatus Parcubacteria bacterium]
MDNLLSNELIKAIVIIIVFFLGSYLVTFLMTMLEKATSKSKTNLDDKIIQATKLPVRYLAILLGFFFAFRDFGWTWMIKEKEFGMADIFFVFIAILVAFTASRIMKTVFSWYGETEKGENVNQTMFIFSRKVVSALVYLIAAMIILGQFEIQIGPLLAGLGVMGLAIAFGLQETMANLFAALFLVMDKSINVGDWIKLESGTKAYIEDISWRSVRIRTIGGNTVIVPNSKFVSQNISSYDYPVRSFYTSIGVGVAYGTDLEKAEYVAMQAAEKVIKDEEVTEQENNPIVRYKEFGESSIDFIVIVKVDSVQDEGRIKHALIKQIAKDFEAANIEIPFPQRVVHKA